jgi:hypothetical protein
MKKQLVIIGIVTILVVVGLSGCGGPPKTPDDYQPPQGDSNNPPILQAVNFTVEDNCLPAFQKDGTVWVNFTVQNIGGYGEGVVYCRLFQGTVGYENCGNGTVYNLTKNTQMIYFPLNSEYNARFKFEGVNCENGSGCYKVEIWTQTL